MFHGQIAQIFERRDGLRNGRVRTTEGDLLKAEDRYIVHQCNCVTTRSAGLASSMFQAFPYADIYADRITEKGERNDIDKVGTVIVRGDGTKNRRFVVNLLGQVYPGKPNVLRLNDTASKRLQYFERGLQELAKIVKNDKTGPNTVGFPLNIGCDLAGGKWEDYEMAIQNFAKKSDAIVTIYCLVKNSE